MLYSSYRLYYTRTSGKSGKVAEDSKNKKRKKKRRPEEIDAVVNGQNHS